MATAQDNSVPVQTANWFLFSETGQPLCEVSRIGDGAIPTVGTHLTGNGDRKSAEVVELTGLGAACNVRRLRLVVRTMG